MVVAVTPQMVEQFVALAKVIGNNGGQLIFPPEHIGKDSILLQVKHPTGHYELPVPLNFKGKDAGQRLLNKMLANKSGTPSANC